MIKKKTVFTLNVYDRDYFKVHQIVNINKMKFLEEFSDFETMVIRKMFLQLKFDILSENNSRLAASAKNRIKKDVEKQLETFDKFYDHFRKCKNYPSQQEAKITQIIFKEYIRKSLKYYSFLKLMWKENETSFILIIYDSTKLDCNEYTYWLSWFQYLE